MRDRSDSNEGGAVMCVGGGACVGSGGVSEDYCRVTALIRELWEDFPYSFPFFLNSIRLSLWSAWKEKDSGGGDFVVREGED